MLGVLDRQVEEVKFNGGFYKQRHRTAQGCAGRGEAARGAAAGARSASCRRRVRRRRASRLPLTESGKRQVEAAELDTAARRDRGRSGRRCQARCTIRNGTRMVQAELKRLEPLALEVERQRVGAERLPGLQEQPLRPRRRRGWRHEAREAKRAGLARGAGLQRDGVSHAGGDRGVAAEKARQDAAIAMIRARGRDAVSRRRARAQARAPGGGSGPAARERPTRWPFSLRTNQELDRCPGRPARPS